MSRIYSSLRNLRDRARASVSIKTQNILFFTALFLIILLAIVIRLSPLVEGNLLIKAFDPWIQYYNAEYLSTHTVFQYFNWHDFKSWFPEGYQRGDLRPGLTFTVVIIFYVINSLGIPVSLYNVCFFFPAFMGGATVFAAYLVGKEVLDRKCGLVAAFFLALNTGYMQRTTAGFFDNETIGVFATLMCFYFFLKTVRTGSFVNAVLGGLFLGYLALSWGGYNFVFLILPVVCGIIILMKKYTSNVLIAYAGVEGIGLVVFGIYRLFNYNKLFTSIEIFGVFIFTIILIIYHLIYNKRSDFPKFYNGLINLVKWGFLPGILIIAVVVWIAPNLILGGIEGRLQSVLSPLIRDTENLTASVAEHMPSSWSSFYYSTLIPLVLLPLGLFFLFKKANAPEILLIIFLILIFYFTGSMIRIILLFAPAACLVGAYGLVSVLKIFGSFYGEKRSEISRKRKRQLKRTVGKSEIGAVYFIVGLMCVAQIAHASNIAITQLSQSQIAPGGDIHDWEESLTWMKSNLPGTTVVVSWWDYGYWLTPIGNMTTVNDNGTINQTRIGLTGMAMMQTNEIYSAKIFKALHADYVLVYFGYLYSALGGDEGKWPWMLRICNDNYNIYKNVFGMEEDNWAPNSVFLESEYWDDDQQKPRENWFESTLVKLMFYGVSTEPYEGTPQNFQQYYRQQVNSRTDANGNTYASNIPANGIYDFNVFIPAYFSVNGFVKLFKVDYTALESDFEVEDPVIYDSGFGTINLNNIGTKNLTIKDIQVNGKSYDYKLGKGINTNKLNSGEEDLAWIDIAASDDTFKVNDVVNVTVIAESIALDDKTFTFSRSTDSFFVKEAPIGAVRINKENSNVIQFDEDTAEIFLEVENIGTNNVILESFYIDSEENTIDDVFYLSGSPILEPGAKAYVKLSNFDDSFYPIRTFHKIGVRTPNNARDEILMTSNIQDFELSILSDQRIVSPEKAAILNSDFRNHIPIDLDDTRAYKYDNGTTIMQIRVKNTGDIILGLDSIYLSAGTSWESVSFTPFNLNAGEENVIEIIVPSSLTDIEVNSEIGIIVTANFDGATKASDIGYIHVIKDQPDINIFEEFEGIAASFIAANETGQLLIKNTGNEVIELENLYINETTMLSFDSDIPFESGDKVLDLQETALVSFNIPGLKINQSNLVNVNVTTNTTAFMSMDLIAAVNSTLYSILMDDPLTAASESGNLVITIDNTGILNVTVEGVYINGTYIDLSYFTETIYDIGSGGSITLTIPISSGPSVVLEDLIGDVIVSDDLEILVRTKEGAEHVHLEQVLL